MTTDWKVGPCANCGHLRHDHQPGHVNPCQHTPTRKQAEVTGLMRCDCDGYR